MLYISGSVTVINIYLPYHQVDNKTYIRFPDLMAVTEAKNVHTPKERMIHDWYVNMI